MTEPQHCVEAGISAALHDAGEMVVKWVLVCESMDDTGNRGVWTITDDDATTWDTLGLLTYALQQEQALTTSPDED